MRRSSGQTERCAKALFLLAALFVSFTAQAQFPAGDTWGVVRGDNSPGLRYSTFVETPSGRWLAAGPGGSLMYSDNQGGAWNYDVITDETGRPLFGNISDMVVHNGQLVATLVSFKLSEGQTGQGGPPLPYIGRTQILTSDNDGDSWTVADFPVPNAVFGGPISGFPFPGVFLPHLFVTPGGDLLAYGTTAQSSGVFAFFIGGVVFRRTGTILWEQVAFELGVVQSMDTGASGELIASGFRTLLESEDGILWNGHSTVDANFSLNGVPLEPAEKELLNGSDITYIDGQYVMQTQEFRRSRNNPNIIVASNQRSVVYRSPDPFAPSREWTGTQVSRIWPGWINVDSRLLSVVDAAWTSSNGVNWTNVDSSVAPLALSVGRVGAQGVVAVGSSDEVWTSNDAGQTWSKILDQNPGPDLFIRGKVNDVLLAVGLDDSLYRSVDNGQTWVEAIELVDITPFRAFGSPAISDGRIYVQGNFTDRILTSEDTGLTWEEILVPNSSSRELADVVVGDGGRLIVPQPTFSPNIHISDDGGETWDTRPSPLAFEDIVKRGLHVGGGRIIYMLNTGLFSSSPKLLTSNDNGSTWQLERPFDDIGALEGSIDLTKIIQTESGTLVIHGGSAELLVSRDLGLSWELELDLEDTEPEFLNWRISDVFESAGRLVAIAYRSSPNGGAFRANYAYISEDEGATWRRVPIPTSENVVAFLSGIVGADGRMIITGNNGAVYVSDPVLTEAQPFRVREAETLTIDVPRPPVAGDTTVDYRLVSATAIGDTDFVQASGELIWTEGDSAAKQIVVETIDDPFNEVDELFKVEFNVPGDLIYSWTYDVTISDDEGIFALPTNADIEIDGAVRTSEDGTSVEFGVAISRNPSEDVTLGLSVDLAEEITFSPSTLTFTPDNWQRVQPVTVTGLDDSQPDGNRTVQLTFETLVAGPEYNSLDPGIAYIINEDNEDPNIIFASGFESVP